MLVHQHGLAHALLSTVRLEDAPLLILTGHDHKQHLEQNESAVLVPSAPAELRFTGTGVARTVDLVDVEPLSGNAVARRVA